MRIHRIIQGYVCVAALSCTACSSSEPANATGSTSTNVPGVMNAGWNAAGMVAAGQAGKPATPVTTQVVPPPVMPAIQPNAGVGSAGMSAVTPPPVVQVAGTPAVTPPMMQPSAAGAGTTTPDAGMIPAKVCTGKPGKKRGKSDESVMAGGKRTFVYYAPENLDANKPAPLVIIPHGYTQSGQAMYDITRYSDIADREGFVVAYPDGAPGSVGPWDVGTGVCGAGSFVPGSGDDQKFIDEMIAFAEADQCIDKEHIYITGWSMGGYLANHSGCLRDDIRAIGPHSAGTHDLSSCKVGPKPVILFHFNPDGLINYDCGVKARDEWVKHNGCTMDSPEIKMVKGGKCEYYQGCKKEGQVAFCTFDLPANHQSDFLAGHAWSGGTVHSYSISETESAAELGWAFFKNTRGRREERD